LNKKYCCTGQIEICPVGIQPAFAGRMDNLEALAGNMDTACFCRLYGCVKTTFSRKRDAASCMDVLRVRYALYLVDWMCAAHHRAL